MPVCRDEAEFALIRFRLNRLSICNEAVDENRLAGFQLAGEFEGFVRALCRPRKDLVELVVATRVYDDGGARMLSLHSDIF
jgi:hypothetical protein